MMSETVTLPPGTSCGSFIDGDEFEYLSDQNIAAGRTPNSTNTNKNMKQGTAQPYQVKLKFIMHKLKN